VTCFVAGGDTISEAQRDKEREKELAQERKKADIKETKKEAEESYMSLLEYCRSVGMSQWEAADFLESGRVKVNGRVIDDVRSR